MTIKLLIVDDEPPARAKLRRLLAAMPGIGQVIEAANATEALALVEQHEPDAALLDIQMPGRSGLELALALPDRGPQLGSCQPPRPPCEMPMRPRHSLLNWLA